MTPKHWFKMFGGMFAIFMVGMFLVSQFRHKRDHFAEMAVTAVSGIEAASHGDDMIPVRGYPFRMNGEVIGEMTKLRLDRDGGSRHLDGMYYTVKLNDGVDVNQFASCQLVPKSPGQLDASSDWTCLDHGDTGYEGLEDFGRIEFISAPGMHAGSQKHVLMVPESFVEALHADGVGSVRIDSDRRNFQITIDGKQIVNIQGNGNAGTVIVKHPVTGENLVEVHGGPEGGTVKVKGVTTIEGKSGGN